MSREKQVAQVRCSGGSLLNEGIVRTELPKNCTAILELYADGIQSCTYGCLGAGNCVEVCPLNAIALNERNIAAVDRNKCEWCGLCAEACPQQLIEPVLWENVIMVQCVNRDAGTQARKECDSSCIGCGICEKSCTNGAIFMVDNHACINSVLCISCGMCATRCPRGSIHDINGMFAAV